MQRAYVHVQDLMVHIKDLRLPGGCPSADAVIVFIPHIFLTSSQITSSLRIACQNWVCKSITRKIVKLIKETNVASITKIFFKHCDIVMYVFLINTLIRSSGEYN